MTPYAITRFEADQTYQTSNKDSETVLNEVKEHMLSDTILCSEISGTFKKCTYA